jgi:hypothetical protein
VHLRARIAACGFAPRCKPLHNFYFICTRIFKKCLVDEDEAVQSLLEIANLRNFAEISLFQILGHGGTGFPAVCCACSARADRARQAMATDVQNARRPPLESAKPQRALRFGLDPRTCLSSAKEQLLNETYFVRSAVAPSFQGVRNTSSVHQHISTSRWILSAQHGPHMEASTQVAAMRDVPLFPTSGA